MKSSEVRSTYLKYFQDRGHKLQPSSSVVPHGDKTLLFTNAGMVQFKDIFTGQQAAPEPPRATTSQKCIRAGGKHNDLDNVGYTTRHLTFFEMLGNFSFGDYFKEDAIRFAWELITEEFSIPPRDLWVTVYKDDDEAWELWKDVAGVSEDRIVRLGDKDNFWSMGDVGPCGPCSEILIDRGDKYGEADVENGERFFEIWNLVFMQYDQIPGEGRKPLPRPSIDTGMGLERMAMVQQGVDTVFDTDILQSLIRKIEEISGVPYDAGPAGVPHRVLSDHVRSLVFSLADGAEISNEGRGYVLRRILRRASRYGRKIHTDGAMLHRLVDTLVDEMGDAYPEIVRDRAGIQKQIRLEEERFGETLDRGIDLFEEVAARLEGEGGDTVPGAEIFRLYDTFGFPVDLVERMSEEANLKVDLPGFEACMEQQKTRSRGASGFSAASDDREAQEILATLPETEFIGYDQARDEAELLAAFERDGLWSVVLSRTPFYAESGGQVGDTGWIEGDGFQLVVRDTKKERGRFLHICEIARGDAARLRSGVGVKAAIDESRRDAILRNHSATHLLHAALRVVLGSHVRQKGSLVSDQRLRFDVSHSAAIEPAELEEAAGLVREQILRDVPVDIQEMGRDEAIEAGAMAFFGEKYGDTVRVVRMGEFSMELCGGCHVQRTGEIGPFLIAHEGSVSSGVRRLEALTAAGADEYHDDHRRLILELSRSLKVKPDGLLDRVQKLIEDNRDLRSSAKKDAAATQPGDLRRVEFGDILLLLGLADGVSGKDLRATYDAVKKESPRLITLLLARSEGKVQILVTVSKALEKDGWSAKALFDGVAGVLEARGGGRPAMVQAGGAAPQGAEAALKAFEDRVRKGP